MKCGRQNITDYNIHNTYKFSVYLFLVNCNIFSELQKTEFTYTNKYVTVMEDVL